MSATVAAALKKIAVAILTDKKLRKTFLGIVLGIIVIIVMPFAAIIALFNGGINIDTNRLQTLVVQNMSAEEQARLQRVEDLMYEIEDKMTEAGFDNQRVKEAQVLYVLALSDFSEEAGFVDKLVGCFADGQSDADLIAAVNAAFGTDLSAEDFTKVMSAIRAVYISTAGYIDPSTKNNLDLVQWAKNAYSRGWGYVWGTYGEVLTRSLYKAKAEQYPDEVGGYADFIEEHWIGGRTADCVGLIKGYGWFDPETGKIEYGTNGMPDIGADTMYANAEESGTIDTIPEIPGLAVWHEGHIGIYIGNGQVIHASGTKVGVVQTPIGNSGWTHWLKIPYITYYDSDVTEAPNEQHIWDVLYAKIGNPYGIVSELATDERIAALYDLWYAQREEVIRTYTEELPDRISLVDNPEFKSIKNVVIQEALNISADRLDVDEQNDRSETEAEVPEPEADEVEKQEYTPAPKSVQRSRMWQLYRNAKELLDRENDAYDPNTAVNLLIEAAGLGCGVAKYRLGKMFLRGEDVPKNIEYALRWLEESVSEGNQYAEYLLGKTLLRGEDVEQDFQRAEDLLCRSSNQGNRYASYTLGKTLLDGELLLQDIPEAIRLLADSADKGFAAAQYLMGKLLYHGEVIQQDVARAIDYLERAAGQKNPYAAYLVGKILLTEAEVKDVFRAIRNFEIAAENGNDYAEYQLGKIYLYGKEVERDYEKAIAYLSSAAEHGNPYAEQLLHSIRSNRNWSASLGAIRLLHHLSRMIQNQLDDEKKGKAGAIDRKLKRKIDEKKQAHGLKQG